MHFCYIFFFIGSKWLQRNKSISFQNIPLNSWTGKEIPIPERTKKLRELLSSNGTITIMPCCYDGITAKLIESAGFDLTFMTGFGVSASYGFPDTGLMTASEMLSSARMIVGSLKKIPCIGDGDTVSFFSPEK